MWPVTSCQVSSVVLKTARFTMTPLAPTAANLVNCRALRATRSRFTTGVLMAHPRGASRRRRRSQGDLVECRLRAGEVESAPRETFGGAEVGEVAAREDEVRLAR